MKNKDQILLEQAYKQIREGSSWWGPTASDFKSTIAQTKKDKYSKSDAELVLAYAAEPGLSELASHYDPRGIHKKELTPQQVKHDLKYLAFGNSRAGIGMLDPENFKKVYSALVNKLKNL